MAGCCCSGGPAGWLAGRLERQVAVQITTMQTARHDGGAGGLGCGAGPACVSWLGVGRAMQIPPCKHGHRIASPQDIHQPAAMAQAVALQAAVAPASRSSTVSGAPALHNRPAHDAAAADRAAALPPQARPFSSGKALVPLRPARAEARQAIVCAGASTWAGSAGNAWCRGRADARRLRRSGRPPLRRAHCRLTSYPVQRPLRRSRAWARTGGTTHTTPAARMPLTCTSSGAPLLPGRPMACCCFCMAVLGAAAAHNWIVCIIVVAPTRVSASHGTVLHAAF